MIIENQVFGTPLSVDREMDWFKFYLAERIQFERDWIIGMLEGMKCSCLCDAQIKVQEAINRIKRM